MTTLSKTRPSFESAGLVVGLAMLVAWPFALSRFRNGDVYAVIGPFAIVVIAVLAGFGAKLRPRVVDRGRVARDAAIGLACGVVMTLLTYVAYAAAVRLVPSLAAHVSSLYAASKTEAKAPALVWTVVVLVAEEMLWRGPLLPALSHRAGRNAALAISLVTYVAAQSASGSPVVALAALICGAIWLAERALTGSMVAPLVSHLIWTPVVIHLYPVTIVQ